ncbi:cytochrome P450 [Actinoalloteichus sp. AHMU CJ021]|uniref:cytochrome P450 n=1 Tax=Actinoalloteichus TaxID=65496 RepID=UPI000403C8A1|nr:cytochrome P450 [Actinoalloteichus caeruleus]AUS81255.1 cytochrome P450 [Actinoalloteichus sp. AHMU CJ021]
MTTDHGRRTPPGPSRWETPSMLRKLAADRLGLMSTAAARFGDASRLAIGPKALYFFNHPDHAKHVLADNAGNYHKGIGLVQARRALGDGLLTSEGELWRTQRRTIQPVFQQRRITGLAPVVAEEATTLVDRLRARVGGPAVDLVAELNTMTLGVLGRTLLDVDLNAFDTVGHAFEAVQDQAMFEMVTMGTVPTWAPLPRQQRFRRARAELRRIVDRLVADRDARGPRRQGVPDDDVLSRLIESTRREPDPRVGATRMRDELVTLLLAGHETTASTLGWSLHLIDRHPPVAERLRAEARAVLGDRAPRHEDLTRLTYTQMVVKEAMRLYPPVWILPRIAQEDDEVGGYHVPAGADVLICPYTLHRHPAWWPDPDRFDPERFAPDQLEGRPRYAYLPFGAGPRFCVGSNLGMLEAVFVLAVLMRELRLTGVPGRAVVPEPMLSLRVRGGLAMTVHRAE